MTNKYETLRTLKRELSLNDKVPKELIVSKSKLMFVTITTNVPIPESIKRILPTNKIDYVIGAAMIDRYNSDGNPILVTDIKIYTEDIQYVEKLVKLDSVLDMSADIQDMMIKLPGKELAEQLEKIMSEMDNDSAS